MEVVRGYSRALLEKLVHLGKGARAADERRTVIKRLEERRKRER